MYTESNPPHIITPEDVPKSVAQDTEALGIESNEKVDKLVKQYSVGEVVIVERSGKDGAAPTLEQGWTVESIDSESGKVLVASPDRTMTKKFTPEKLESLQQPFKIGDVVAVRRNAYDAEGKKIAGGTIEPGWSVESIDTEADVVTVSSQDGVYEKSYSVSALLNLQPTPVKTPEAPIKHIESRAELLQEVQHDLGEEAVEEAGVEVSAASRIIALDNKETRKDPLDYLRSQFPPVVRPEKTPTPGQANEYDKLLFGDTSDQPWNKAPGYGQYEPETAEDKQRKYYDKFVTQENRENSLETLEEAMKATPEIREILVLFNIEPHSIAAVDAIRENPEVRFEIAKVLVGKLDRLAADPYNDLGWRVAQNSPNNLKVDSVTGKRMLSRTYAVDMALKMIGGEFSVRQEGSDPIERGSDDKIAMGQHRHAASSTLMSRI